MTTSHAYIIYYSVTQVAADWSISTLLTVLVGEQRLESLVALYTRALKMVQLDCCRRSQSNPLYDKPAREKHFFSMAASIISVVLLIISLPLPAWATAVVADHYCSFGLIKVSCMTTKTRESIYEENISRESLTRILYDSLIH